MAGSVQSIIADIVEKQNEPLSAQHNL